MSEPLTDDELAKLESDQGYGGEGYWTGRLVAEVRRLRAELLRRNIPQGGCQCACHGCQWCEC